MEDINQTISALTLLISLNDKRRKVYQSFAKKMHHDELRSLFSKYAEQSRQFSVALSTWRSAYGGFAMPEKKGIGSVGTRITAWFEHWLRKNVASKCEEMEQETLKAYRTAIRAAFLPEATAADLDKQLKEFEKALARLRTLREQSNANGSVGEELVRTLAF